MSVRSRCSSTAPASIRDRSSRSVVSFSSRATPVRNWPRKRSRVGSSSCSSSSSSTKPLSEKIGVRSSCDAVAMKRRRALSSSESWICIASSAAARRPSSSSLSTVKWAERSPPATWRAVSSSLETRRPNESATRYPAIRASTNAITAASRIRLRTSATLRSTLPSGAENTSTSPSTRRPVSGSFEKSGIAASPIRPLATDSTAVAVLPEPIACSAAGKTRLSIALRRSESDLTNGAVPFPLLPTPISVTRALARSAASRTARSISPTGAASISFFSITPRRRWASSASCPVRWSVRLDCSRGTTPA